MAGLDDDCSPAKEHQGHVVEGHDGGVCHGCGRIGGFKADLDPYHTYCERCLDGGLEAISEFRHARREKP